MAVEVLKVRVTLLTVVAILRELKEIEFELRVHTADATVAPLTATVQPLRLLRAKAEV